MHIRTAGSWSAVCIGIIAGAVIAIWPNQRWIAEAVLLCTVVALAAIWGWWCYRTLGRPKMIPLALIAVGAPLLLIGMGWWIIDTYRAIPKSPQVAGSREIQSIGGKGGKAKIIGSGVAIGGPGGHAGGGSGRGGDGGSAEIHGNGLAAGGAGGSVDGPNVWYPPAISGYENAMRQTGKRPDPALKMFGRGGMSPGYASKFNVVEKLRAEYFKAHNQTPRSIDEDINAVPLQYLNDRLAATGESWRARVTATEQYEFYTPQQVTP